MIAYLNYGVLGLCAIMLILVARMLRTEQAREKPRREITRLATLYMAFAIVLAVLNGYVQLKNPPGNPEIVARAEASREQYRQAKAALDILRVRVGDAVAAKEAWLEQIPEGTSVRNALRDLDRILGEATAAAALASSPQP